MATVCLEGITRRFNRIAAIEDVTFEVPDGQFWVLVGPSGCGKTTILRTIAGLESATAGDLYIGGVLMNQIPARQRDVAMVFQNYALYPHLSVAENLAFGLRMRRVDAKMIRERVETVARSLNIAHLLDRKPRQLSGGQQQRVALGRAIARQPKAFLLDEPLSNLDAQLRDDTRAELKQLHQRWGVTTIYVTHDQLEAMTLADRIVVLNQGQIQQIGSPQTIYNRPVNRMVATFLGSPPMNLLPVTWLQEKFQLAGQLFSCPPVLQAALSSLGKRRFDLGIRPEHLQVVAPDAGHLSVNVTVVEPLGRETLIRTAVPTETLPMTLNLQAPPTIQPQPGDCLKVQLNLDELFIFDQQTGCTFYPPA